MQGVGPGTVLGGRYGLRHRLSQDPGLERWSAHDATLEREVTLTIVGSEHANRAGLLDAARRAAGVEDTRLVRILDVGTQKDSSFIVEEAMSGSESLATLLLQGPLPAEEARRVAGETAQGLESAGQRGLHHLRLTPQHVLVAPDGAIRVSGVAVAAAMDGPDEQEPDAATASRRDALRLVAVVYAALTGRWPLDETVSGMEPAPRVADGVAAPSEIAAGVPRDLDALCRITLNEASGPLTPGEFASRIAPWPRERVPRAEVDPTVAVPVPSSGDAANGVDVSDGASPLAEVSEPTVAISTHDIPARDQESTRPESVDAGDRAHQQTAHEQTASEQMTLPEGFARQFDNPVEPPLPLLPDSTALPPSRGQSKIVVLVVAVFVGLALFVGYRGLLGPSSSSTTVSKPTPRRTVTVSAPPVTVPASPAPGKPATAAGPIAILSATGFDPQGDNRESNPKAARVYDGDLATSWTSELYTTADFGNLKKGVGVLLDLGQPTSVHDVTIDLGGEPVDLTAYAASDPSIKGATVIGKATAASGRTQIKATKTMPKAQYVIVWFTKLAPDKGQFTASIEEIALN